MKNKRKYRNKVSKPDIAQNPVERYSVSDQSFLKQRITISSFSEQAEEMRRYWASITPEQRLRHLYEMICLSYGLDPEQSNNNLLNNRINIISPDEHFS